jgi:hypothetical protein
VMPGMEWGLNMPVDWMDWEDAETFFFPDLDHLSWNTSPVTPMSRYPMGPHSQLHVELWEEDVAAWYKLVEKRCPRKNKELKEKAEKKWQKVYEEQDEIEREADRAAAGIGGPIDTHHKVGLEGGQRDPRQAGNTAHFPVLVDPGVVAAGAFRGVAAVATGGKRDRSEELSEEDNESGPKRRSPGGASLVGPDMVTGVPTPSGGRLDRWGCTFFPLAARTT